ARFVMNACTAADELTAPSAEYTVGRDSRNFGAPREIARSTDRFLDNSDAACSAGLPMADRILRNIDNVFGKTQLGRSRARSSGMVGQILTVQLCPAILSQRSKNEKWHAAASCAL